MTKRKTEGLLRHPFTFAEDIAIVIGVAYRVPHSMLGRLLGRNKGAVHLRLEVLRRKGWAPPKRPRCNIEPVSIRVTHQFSAPRGAFRNFDHGDVAVVEALAARRRQSMEVSV